MTYRDYQHKYIDNIKQDKSNLLIGFMGSGKSLILKGIIDKYYKDKKVLIIVGRRDITLQLATYYSDHSYILSGKDYDESSNIFLATFQTLIRRDIDLSTFDMIVIDEVHERFETKIVKEIRELDCTRIYMTGTPLKNNGRFLGKFDNILEYTNARQMIEDGYIAKTKFISKANILSDESSISSQNGDYKDYDIERVIDKQALIGWLVADNKEYEWSTKHKCILYANSIATATKILDAMNDKDNIRILHSKLSKKDKEETWGWFKNCKNGIIINCRILTVGVDIPSVNTVINVTPTRILSLYLQSIWRASRPYEDKTTTVYDYTGNLLKEGFSPYFNDWKGKRDKKSCREQCLELPENSIARSMCLKSCTVPEEAFIVCKDTPSCSYEQDPYSSGYRLVRGKSCGVGSAFYEWSYKNTVPENSLGIVRKWSECPNCKAVYVYELETMTQPSKAVEVYKEEIEQNSITFIFNKELNVGLIILDDMKLKNYKYQIVGSSGELYEYALQHYKGRRFTIEANIPLKRLGNVTLNRGLTDFVKLVNWDKDKPQGIMRKVIKYKVDKLALEYNWSKHYSYHFMKGVKGNERFVNNKLDRIQSKYDLVKLGKSINKG